MQPDLEVKYFNLDEAEVVQHMQSAYLPIWVGLLDSFEDRRRKD